MTTKSKSKKPQYGAIIYTKRNKLLVNSYDPKPSNGWIVAYGKDATFTIPVMSIDHIEIPKHKEAVNEQE